MAANVGPRTEAAHPRRAPIGGERRRDADRSRQVLLSAALEEFSAKGFAGARVHDIAERAGVNKQLINYYFDSKDGLYREVQRTWFARRAGFGDPALELDLDELAERYLRDALDDPRLTRLLLWRGLSDRAVPVPDVAELREDLSSMHRRQAAGELDDELDVGCVLLAIMAMVAAPVAMPHMVHRIFGVEPGSAEFAERYGEQLRRMVRHLRPCRPEGLRQDYLGGGAAGDQSHGGGTDHCRPSSPVPGPDRTNPTEPG